MGNEIPQQLAQFFRSILLGSCLALFYDIIRVLQLHGGKLWEIILDSIIGITTAASLFFMIMAEDGELRLFILMGVLGGAVLFFCLISSPLRPILSFWIHFFLIPLHFGFKILKLLRIFFKKVFSFLKKWFTITVTIILRLSRGEREHGTQSQTIENAPQQ